MDLSKLTREEFDQRLESRSMKDLRSMAASHRISVPAGLDSKEAVLDLLFEALGSKVSAPGPGSTSASGAPPPNPSTPGPGRIFSCLNTTPSNVHWRFGLKFLHEWTDYPEHALTPAQWEFLRGDKEKGIAPYPHIRVREKKIAE